MKYRLLAATALVVASSAYAADNMTVKDGTGATKVLAKKDVGSVLYDKNIIVLQSDVTVDAMAQIDGHVDGIESLLTTETNNTSAISGKLPATLGSKTGATSLSVVPANDGFAVQCTSGCNGGTQYQEDAASANADLGTVSLAVRKAIPANTSGADGDYEALQIANGLLWTNDKTLNTIFGTSADTTDQSGACGTFLSCVVSMRDDLRTMATDTSVLTVKTDQTTHGTTDLVAADITKVGGAAIVTGNGVTGSGSPRVTISSDNTPIQTRNAGVSTPVRIVSAAASTNLTEIADSGGCRIVSIAGAVARTSAVYLKLYNAADGSVTVGTTTPYITLPLPAGGSNPTSFQFDVNQVFASGACSLAMTTAVADNSTAALTAADVVGLTVIWGTN